jgi:hypothetical protein
MTDDDPPEDDDRSLDERIDDLAADGDATSHDGDGEGLSAEQEDKIDEVVGQARERNPEALARAEALRAREEQAGIPATDEDSNPSPATKAVLDALTGGVANERGGRR